MPCSRISGSARGSNRRVGGNLWKWVIKPPGLANPSPSELHQSGWIFRKFFSDDPTASTAPRRSFFHPAGVTYSHGKLLIALGSGERADLLCDASTGCTRNNRFYVLTDPDPHDFFTSTDVIDGRAYPTGDLSDVTPFEDDCPSTRAEGYFHEIPLGEKFTSNTEIFGGFVFVSSFAPTAGSACEPNGRSQLYGFLASCGQGFFGDESAISPIANESRTLDLGGGFATDPRLSIAPGEGGNRLIINKQDGDLITLESGSTANDLGQVYWRELDN